MEIIKIGDISHLNQNKKKWRWFYLSENDEYCNFVKTNFMRFLKDNNIYRPFINNFIKRRKLYADMPKFAINIDYLISYCGYRFDFIDYAFNWDATKEGYIFWQRYNDKLIVYMKVMLSLKKNKKR